MCTTVKEGYRTYHKEREVKQVFCSQLMGLALVMVLLVGMLMLLLFKTISIT